ncbi:hypothetical protein Tco_0732589 [Tanacetum coccineum]
MAGNSLSKSLKKSKSSKQLIAGSELTVGSQDSAFDDTSSLKVIAGNSVSTDLRCYLMLSAVDGPDLVLEQVKVVFSCTKDRKPLALSWGRTPRLDSGIRGSLVLGFPSISLIAVMARVGPLSGKGPKCDGTGPKACYPTGIMSAYLKSHSLVDILPPLLKLLSFVNQFLRFLLLHLSLDYQFLADVLGHFHIHLSQLSVFGAAKVSHFEILCRIHRFQPSVNCFRMFYTSSYTKGWMSFVKRSDATPVCHSKPLNSILSKDPPPKLSQYDIEACDFLRTHTAPFWKFPEPFLCWVGISRYYTLDENCYSTFWDSEEGGYILLWERDLTEREVKLLKMTEGRTVLLDPLVTAVSGDSGDSIDKLFDDGDDDVLEETIAKDASKAKGGLSCCSFQYRGKSLASIRDLVPDGSSVPGGVTEPPTVVSVPPTSDDRPTDSVFGLNLRTSHPSLRYVVSLDDSHHSGSCSEVKSFARSPATDVPVTTVAVTTTVTTDVSVVPPPKVRVVSKNLEIFRDSTFSGTSKLNEPADSSDSFYTFQDLDYETLHRIYVPNWNVTNDFVLDYLYMCRDLMDRLALPALFSQLRAMDYDQLYFEFNVGAARQRDTKIAHLKSLLSLKEAEAAEAIRLRCQISMIEYADVAKAKGDELRDLKERSFVLEGEKDALFEKVKTLESAAALKETEVSSLAAQVAQLTSDLSGFQLSHDELSSKVASLESKRDSLVSQKSSLESAFELFSERMEATQDEQARVLGNRVAELDAQLLEMAAHLNEEFYIRFLTGLIMGKQGYDPSTETKYVEAVNVLSTVDFSLLSELKSKKGANIVDLTDSLCLEGPLAEIPVSDLSSFGRGAA